MFRAKTSQPWWKVKDSAGALHQLFLISVCLRTQSRRVQEEKTFPSKRSLRKRFKLACLEMLPFNPALNHGKVTDNHASQGQGYFETEWKYGKYDLLVQSSVVGENHAFLLKCHKNQNALKVQCVRFMDKPNTDSVRPFHKMGVERVATCNYTTR